MKKIILLFSLIFSHFFFAQSDCVTAFSVCGNSALSYTPSGLGNVAEDLGGCLLSDEHYSVWYSFTIATSGTLAFTINPNNATTDYDFAVYGPNKTCSNFGAPIRCNFSGTPGPTGLSLSVIHPAVQNQWSGYLNVVAGETYYLVVDNYSHNTTGFQLLWTGTASLTSPYNSSTQPNPFIAPGPLHNGNIAVCQSPTTFNFTTLSAGILNGNPNFIITYHTNVNDAVTGANPITTANVTTSGTYYYSIHYQDPNNPNNPINNCRQTGNITFTLGTITAVPKTISTCEVNQTGTGVWNLTTAQVYTSATIPFSIKYYLTLADANAGTNEITNPTTYSSVPGTVFAKVTRTDLGCTSTAAITLSFGPKVSLLTTDTTLNICASNFHGTSLSDLQDFNSAFTADASVSVDYYPTLQDAYNQTNALTGIQTIQNTKTVYLRVKKAGVCDNFSKLTLVVDLPTTKNADVCDTDLDGKVIVYLSDYANLFTNSGAAVTAQFYNNEADAVAQTNPVNGAVQVSGTKAFYVRIKDPTTCDKFAIFNLTIKVPSKSDILVNQTICVESKTRLDAGLGFSAYEWNTGETTAAISNVGLGTYWVNLTSTNGCTYKQTVEVKGAPVVAVSSVEISNNTVTITVTGGTPPYLYSTNGMTWQESNIFNDVPRGNAHFYIKDAYNCTPVDVQVTVPNIINTITPNGDGVNDILDYSALSYKKNLLFAIYDRYGSKIFEGNSKNNYTWDGRYAGKVTTGTYWYTITWNEPDETAAPVKYSGWILVKNRN